MDMTFLNPQNSIEELGVSEGMRVVDFGAGSGFYALAAAKKVGPEGRVIAVDIQQDLLNRLRQTARDERVSNIETLQADLEHGRGTPLRETSFDVVIVSNILFQVADKKKLLKEAFRLLKPTGRALIIDWKDSYGGMGPHMEDIVTETVARSLVNDVGFTIESSVNAGSHHYGFIARKPKQPKS